MRENIRDRERVSVGLMAPAAQRETLKTDGKAGGRLRRRFEGVGRCADHVRHVDKRLRRLMRECHWQSLRRRDGDAFLRWRAEQTQAPKPSMSIMPVLSPCSPGSQAESCCGQPV